MKTRLLILCAFLIFSYTNAQVYVDASATGANNGTSWADAFTNLQSALVQPGQNQIWIAAGTYTPGNNRAAMFTITSAKSLFGGFNGTETSFSQRDVANNVTRLSGDINGNDTSTIDYNLSERSDNSYRVVLVNSSGVILDGLTISNAHLDDASTTGIQNGSAVVMQANTVISNCTIENNVSHYGGSISLGNNNVNSTPLIQNTVIKNNLAPFAVAFFSPSGINSNIRIVNTAIHDNECRTIGGTATVNNTIWLQANGGTANNLGVVNCTFTRNTFTGGGTRELVRSDHNPFSPGFEFINNIFWNNTASNVRAFHIASGGNNQLDLINNNDENNFSNIPNSAAFFSGNISADPLFVNPLSDFRLSFNSPCLDTGNSSSYNSNATSQIDADGNNRFQGSAIDIGAYEGGNPFVANIILYVDQNATGTNDGSSWANAYTDLQSALSFSQAASVWIAAGTYVPGTARSDTFNLSSQLSLYGGFNGTETMLSQRNPQANPTILSGDINDDDTGVSFSGANRADNSIHVVTINESGCVLDGLTITSGHADSTTIAANRQGAGVNILEGNLTIKNCVIEKNVVVASGVIRMLDENGSLNIENTIISENFGGNAAVLYTRAASGNIDVTLTNCLIKDNQKNAAGNPTNIGLIWFRQDTNWQTTAKIYNTTIVNNEAFFSGSSTTVISSSRLNSGVVNVEVYNSIFNGNINNSTSSNQTLVSVGNGTTQNSGSVYIIKNSLAEDAFGNITNNGSTSININTSNANPLFTSATDFTLQQASPAVDAGDNTEVLSGINIDLAGNNRIVNNIVDMGAYEFDASLSIEEVVDDIINIKIFPNPATHSLNISSKTQVEHALVYDVLGKEVLNAQDSFIDISSLKAGIYLIKIKTSQGEAMKRFIKK